jgi:hypothetical protein
MQADQSPEAFRRPPGRLPRPPFAKALLRGAMVIHGHTLAKIVVMHTGKQRSGSTSDTPAH